MVQNQKTQSPQSVEDQIGILRDDVAQLGKLMSELAKDRADRVRGAAAEGAEELLDRSRKAADDATRRARKAVASIEELIEERPVQSALFAFLIGLVVGSMSRR